jgi:hypothetical protein
VQRARGQQHKDMYGEDTPRRSSSKDGMNQADSNSDGHSRACNSGGEARAHVDEMRAHEGRQLPSGQRAGATRQRRCGIHGR